MKAAILKGAKNLVIEDIPKPTISHDQVLIEIKEVGLCGSDVHFYDDFGIPGFVMIEKPLILGHESSGVIAEVGKNVTAFSVGDRVSIEPGVPCYHCEQCRSGNYNLCDSVVFMATPPIHGAFTEYLAYDPCFVYKIPDNVSFSQGALVEPLSVGYNCAKIGEVKPGQSVCIFGAGPIGLASLDICKTIGATRIFITDVNEYRLDIARKHGAFAAVNVLKEDVSEVVKACTDGRGVDCSIECSGIEKSIIQSCEVIRRGGHVVWLSLGQDIVPISYINIVCKAPTIRGSFRYANSYRPVINLLESGSIKFDGWISHRIAFSNIDEAFHIANNPNVDKMKIIIYM